MTVFEKIEEQQKGCENSPAWMVGQQLKEICYADQHCAEIVSQDLENKDMSLAKAAQKIKEHADEMHKKNKGNYVCIPPNVAEGIIREFYGLPTAEQTARSTEKPAEQELKENQSPFGLGDDIDLFSL